MFCLCGADAVVCVYVCVVVGEVVVGALCLLTHPQARPYYFGLGDCSHRI